jgi:glucosamine--fructose-6-phosphate aminotransferase (isomerizing)
MSSIFGLISDRDTRKKRLRILAMHSRQRCFGSSGLVYYDENSYKVARDDYDIMQLLKKENWFGSNVVIGHSSLFTNGIIDNQPVVCDGIIAIHDGIILNKQEIWESLNFKPQFQVNSETIIAIAIKYLDECGELMELPRQVLSI